MKIADTPVELRPYEKFRNLGIDSLTNTELLAILLRCGTKTKNVEEVASEILMYSSLRNNKDSTKNTPSLLGLFHISFDELLEIDGIGPVRATQIISLVELSKRITKENYITSDKMTNPSMIAKYFMEELRHKREENFIVVLLDAKCKIIGYDIVSKGSLTASIVHPREVYKVAIQKSAHSIVVVHNHPSGDPIPSKEDISITKKLQEGGGVLGIPLLDHIIIGDGVYKSFKEESYL